MEDVRKLLTHYIKMNPLEPKAKACSFISAATHYPVTDILQMAIDVFGPEEDLVKNLEIVKAFYEK